LLFQKRGAPLNSLILGGGQERHRRGGTENILGIHALRVMSEQLSMVEENSSQVQALRDHMDKRIFLEIPEVTKTGGENLRLPNTSSLVLAGVDGETLLMSLDLKGFAVSTGAACSSGNPEPSPVLLAMGLSRLEAQSSLRVSLGWSTTREEIDLFVDVLKEVIQRLRSFQESENADVVLA
jgi:cysteine desulfurase